MTMRSMVRGLFAPTRSIRKSSRLRCEPLEDRTVPATFTVTNTLDDTNPGSLRWAVGQANTSNGADTIDFSSLFLSPQTITMANGQYTLSDTTGETSITGPGVDFLSINGNNASRVFGINAGAVAAFSGLTITGGNAGAASGGGMHIAGTAKLTMTNCTVSGNSSNDGGGVYASGGSIAILTNCTVAGNSSATRGGGLDNNGGTVTLTNCTLTANTAKSNGGGLRQGGSAATTMSGCTLTGNTAANHGGGVYNFGGTTIMTNSTVSSNNAGGRGGGLFNSTGTVTLSNCTFSGNSSNSLGGGLSTYNKLNMSNCTISSNSNGGLRASSGTSTLNNCTVSNNDGGGIVRQGSSTVVLNNTIVADQASGNDISGAVSGSNNLIGTGGSGGLVNGVNGNMVGVAYPGLGALGSYGGLTQTIPLLSDSPAINAGSDATATAAGLTTDQRGLPRFISTVDIGASEALVVDNTGDADNGTYIGGDFTLREALSLSEANPGAGQICFSSVFNTAKTITLNDELMITSPVSIVGKGANLTTILGNGAAAKRVFNFATGNNSTLSGLTITGGKSANGGGILLFVSKLNIDQCAIVGNTATTGDGGGIYVQNQGTLAITNSTLSGNSAVYGGAISFFDSGGTLTLVNSTVSGNSAQTNGGGIYFVGVGGTGMTIHCSTITLNKATSGQGGGIYHNFSATPITIASSIVSGNSNFGSPDMFCGSIVIVSGSAIGSAGGWGGGGGGNLPFGTNLLLGPLAFNGGTTKTHAFGFNSPVIGKGFNPNPGAIITDQRGPGFPRQIGLVDIGAVEYRTPDVTSVLVNDGKAQRSRLTTVTVNFASPVTLAELSPDIGAFYLTRTLATPAGTVGTLVTTNALPGPNGKISAAQSGPSSFVLTFSNANGAPVSPGVESGSLADGRWQLTVTTSGYTSPLNDPNLRRLFGDNDNNGNVDGTDLAAFGASFGQTVANSPFDFNADGTVDALDFGEFGNRFGVTL